jgi:hypothetical protein
MCDSKSRARSKRLDPAYCVPGSYSGISTGFLAFDSEVSHTGERHDTLCANEGFLARAGTKPIEMLCANGPHPFPAPNKPPFR